MNKNESITKKLRNINVSGVFEGFTNKVTGRNEELAFERALICSNCPSMIVEPIEELAITDDRIPVISKKACDECGCSLPYLLRQNKKKCKLKKW